MKIIRIKKSFRKYKEFWYNGMAGAIFFVTELNDAEFKVHEFDPVFSWEDAITGVEKINKQHAGRMVLKRHAEVVGKL